MYFVFAAGALFIVVGQLIYNHQRNRARNLINDQQKVLLLDKFSKYDQKNRLLLIIVNILGIAAVYLSQYSLVSIAVFIGLISALFANYIIKGNKKLSELGFPQNYIRHSNYGFIAFYVSLISLLLICVVLITAG